MAASIADTARKASAGTWRKPRMKVYDYNQELGGNYYQPMIAYINSKTIQGPFFEKKPVEMPQSAEVVSNKYSNMRYDDKSPLNVDIDSFLVQSYAKQIKELNSSTALTHNMILHNRKDGTFFTPNDLTGAYTMASGNFKHYVNELAHMRQEEDRREEAAAYEAEMRRLARLEQMREPEEQGITPEQMEFIRDARTKLYWIYKTRNMKELERWLE
jgi:hypothetical protein